MIARTTGCDRSEGAARREADARDGRFAEALRDARRRAAEPAASRGPAPALPAAEREKGARKLATRAGEEESSARTLAAAVGSREAATVAASEVSALRAAVRAVPPAIAAARVLEGAPLTLSFGPALGVDLQRGAGGLEVTLRPAAALERAAAAELPALVAALRARGLRVSRAEVRARGQSDAGPPARAR